MELVPTTSNVDRVRVWKKCGLITGMKWKRPISQQRSDVAGQFQRLHLCFRGRPTQWNRYQHCLRLISTGAGKLRPSVAGMRWRRPISQHWINVTGQFQRLYPCFWGRPAQRNWCQDCTRLILTGAGKLWTHSWNEVEKARISKLGQRNWTIPTPTPTFLGSTNSMELVPTLPDVGDDL